MPEEAKPQDQWVTAASSIGAEPLSWSEVAERKEIFLNLGGCGDCDPREGYKGFVSVDLRAPKEGVWVRHDLMQTIPLPDGSVSRIHTEEFLQFLNRRMIENLLKECYRLLTPGGHLRLATCDFNHPKDYGYLQKGSSPHRGLLTFLNYELMKDILDQSPFTKYSFVQYWKDGVFVSHAVDYSLGNVRRTPEHDLRNRQAGLRGSIRNFFIRLSKGFRLTEHERVCLRGNPLFVTSLIVDCVKT